MALWNGPILERKSCLASRSSVADCPVDHQQVTPLSAESQPGVRMMENLASGDVTEKDFAEWLRTLDADEPR